jgi:hypothetical protein
VSAFSSPFSRLASATVAGLVSIAAQTFAGVKTFTSAIVASAGIQLGALWNTNGGTAGDVVLKLGTTLPAGSTNATATLVSFRNGIGGTENELITIGAQGGMTIASGGLWVSGNIYGASALTSGGGLIYNNTYCDLVGGSLRGSHAHNAPTYWLAQLGAGATDVCVINGTSVADGTVNATAKLASWRTGIFGTEVEYAYLTKGLLSIVGSLSLTGGASTVSAYQLQTSDGTTFRVANGGIYVGATIQDTWPAARINLPTNAPLTLTGTQANGATAVGTITDTGAAYSTVGAKAHSFRSGGAELAYVSMRGAYGLGTITDTSASPAATAAINAAKGRCAFSSGISALTLTNDQITTDSVLHIEWEDFPPGLHKVSLSANTAVITLPSATAAITKFRWYLVK